ncbi:putative phosphoesterase [Litoreibacter ponti]|uniref:Putative phosphoesterase n=1 Tax=Litoreibacter ponti TaxID=1510457 RepID=A0A2T6BLP6_9RHOB|nr:ligase-associated DNA damage response endonuclease PdeM [Litoreibacter ponti]PTX56907.1 putative phosphoesterase [Litoreibacter ponti]
MKRAFRFNTCELEAFGSGALYWPDEQLLVVSDLHLGKSERVARRSGQMLPPYETIDTLTRLEAALDASQAAQVICLGDSFDDLDAGAALAPELLDWITRLIAGRSWTWIEGNHDPGPLEIGGTHRAEMRVGPLTFRHIAQATAHAEVSGHYHPKASLNAKGRVVTRPCFLYDDARLVLPAFGTFTGGLRSTSETLTGLMAPSARAILTGESPVEIPMPKR